MAAVVRSRRFRSRADILAQRPGALSRDRSPMAPRRMASVASLWPVVGNRASHWRWPSPASAGSQPLSRCRRPLLSSTAEGLNSVAEA